MNDAGAYRVRTPVGQAFQPDTNVGLESPTCTDRWPEAWRFALIALATLILCSCRGPHGASPAPGPSPALPPEAFGATPPWQGEPGPPGGLVTDPNTGMLAAAPVPLTAYGPWAPPGFRQPWPEDEYVRDGGDAGHSADVTSDWQVRGLDLEDTLAHFDTLDGRTLVEPSNRVHLYSPRFGAVRQVTNACQNDASDGWADVYLQTKLTRHDKLEIAASSKQNLQPGRQVGTDLANTFHGRLGRGVVSAALGPQSFQDRFLPYEDLQAVRAGQVVEAEMAFLAQGVQAAVAWEHRQAVQVILDEKAAMAVASNDKLHELFVLNEPPANPRLRIIKVASTPYAEPGDVVDFTLRLDNVGNQPIGNVTIVDNLSARLEYVPESAQCSLKAGFSTQPNQGESLVLRWEIADPLKPGEGGIIRFRCRVR